MCRFSSRCENYYPDPENTSNCLLLCQKNPLALSIALMPDRYLERDTTDRKERTKKVELSQDPSDFKPKAEKMQDEYDEMVSATQELDNEVIEYNPSLNIEDDSDSVDIDMLIKKVTDNRNKIDLDSEITDAIEDSFTEHDEVAVHPLDEINFTPVERVAVADQPDAPNNPAIYIKTRGRGRPKMSEDEKKVASEKRDEEKEERDKIKEEEAVKRRANLKKRFEQSKKKKPAKKPKKK